jgi:hypothetical protein
MRQQVYPRRVARRRRRMKSQASINLLRARAKLRRMIKIANLPDLPPEKRRAARTLARSALAIVKLRQRDAEWRAGRDHDAYDGDVPSSG